MAIKKTPDFNEVDAAVAWWGHGHPATPQLQEEILGYYREAIERGDVDAKYLSPSEKKLNGGRKVPVSKSKASPKVAPTPPAPPENPKPSLDQVKEAITPNWVSKARSALDKGLAKHKDTPFLGKALSAASMVVGLRESKVETDAKKLLAGADKSTEKMLTLLTKIEKNTRGKGGGASKRSGKSKSAGGSSAEGDEEGGYDYAQHFSPGHQATYSVVKKIALGAKSILSKADATITEKTAKSAAWIKNALVGKEQTYTAGINPETGEKITYKGRTSNILDRVSNGLAGRTLSRIKRVQDKIDDVKAVPGNVMRRARIELGAIKDTAGIYAERGVVAAGRVIHQSINNMSAKEVKNTILSRQSTKSDTWGSVPYRGITPPQPFNKHEEGTSNKEPAVYRGRAALKTSRPSNDDHATWKYEHNPDWKKDAILHGNAVVTKGPLPAVFHGRGALATTTAPTSTLVKPKDLQHTTVPQQQPQQVPQEEAKEKESGGVGIGDLLGKEGAGTLGKVATTVGRFALPAVAVAGAGAAGYAAGSYLNEKLGLSDKISDAAMSLFGPKTYDATAPSAAPTTPTIAPHPTLAPSQSKNIEKVNTAAQAEKAVETMKEEKSTEQNKQVVSAIKTNNNNNVVSSSPPAQINQSTRNDESSFIRFMQSRMSFA